MSNNLNLSQMAENQASPEVTHNDSNGELDAAITEFLSVDVTSANATVTAAQFRRNVRLLVTGASVARDVTVQAIKRLFLVDVPVSNTASVTVRLGTTSIVVPPGTRALMYADGTADGLTQVTSATADFYDRVSGAPASSQVVLEVDAVRPFALATNLVGSIVKAGVAATAITDFDVRKNGVSFGTISFAAAGTTATFSTTSQSFAVGDRLTIVAPASADATLADLRFNILGARTG